MGTLRVCFKYLKFNAKEAVKACVIDVKIRWVTWNDTVDNLFGEVWEASKCRNRANFLCVCVRHKTVNK